MNYLVSDMLVRIKNGYTNKKITVVVAYSSFCVKILKLLTLYGFINGFVIINYSIIVKLKYYRNDHIFKNLKLVSKPGCRKYYNVNDLKREFYYRNFVLISNQYGLMSHQESILRRCGGEVLFELNYS